MNRLFMLCLLMLASIASAMPSNYTSILAYDEESGVLINNTNVTIGSQTFNRAQMNYILESNSTEVNGVTGGSGDAELELKENISVGSYADYHKLDSKYTGGDCNLVGASGIAVTFFYSDGTSSSIGQAVTSSYVTYTFQNPYLSKIVANVGIYMQENCASNYYSIKNNVVHAYNLLSMANITATGDTQIIVSSASYYQSSFFRDMQASSTHNISAYLLSTASGDPVIFQAKNQFGSSVPNVNITVEKIINGSYTAVKELRTDSAGSAGTWLKYGSSYRITLTAVGLPAAYYEITPSSSIPYIFTLSSGAVLDMTHLFDNLRYTISPGYAELDAAEAQLVSFDIDSTDNALTGYAMSLYFGNGTLIGDASASAPGGSLLTVTVNLTGHPFAEKLFAEFRFNKTGYPEYLINRSYYVNNMTTGNYSLAGAFSRVSSVDGLSNNAKSFISIIFLFCIVFGLGSIGVTGKSPEGVLFVATIGAGLLTYAGWMDFRIFLALAGLSAIIFIKEES